MSKISLGIIGGGQLGSLLCAAAKNLNINTVVISDDETRRPNILQIILFILSMTMRKI